MMNRVREIRRKKGITQKQLGVMTNLTPAQISIVESGYCPGPILRRRFAEALGVSETELWPELLEKEMTK